jgi:hypothetical protein
MPQTEQESMAITQQKTGKARAVASRIGLTLALVGAIAVIGESQSPEGGQVRDSSAPAALPPTQVSGLPTAAEIPKVGASGDMIGFSHSDSSGTQTITLVHTRKSWMAVYHIDRSGTLRLVSSRPLDADFSLQLNATSPLPEEIRQIGRR